MQLSTTRALQIPVYVKRSTVRVSTGDRSLRQPSVKRELSYFNFCNVPIHVLERSGVMYQIPSVINPQRDRTFVVRVTYTIFGDVRCMMDFLHRREGITPSNEFETLANELYIASTKKNVRGGIFYDYHEFSIDYDFSVNELVEHEKGLYSPELDLVLTLDYTQALNNVHPYSDLGESLNHAASAVEETVVHPFSFFINDRSARYGDRFLRFGNKTYKIPKINDVAYAEGFHVVTPTPIEFEERDFKVRMQVMSLEEAEKEFPIFKTLEAATLGHQSEIDKLDREHRNQVVEQRQLELNLKGEELKVRRDEIRYKRYSMEETIKLDHHKLEDDREKRLYDDLARRRNDKRALRSDIVETIKAVAGILGTVFTLYKLIKR